jgi:hypothetical protein
MHHLRRDGALVGAAGLSSKPCISKGPQDSSTRSTSPSPTPDGPPRWGDQPQSSGLSISFNHYNDSRPINGQATLNSSSWHNHTYKKPPEDPPAASGLHHPGEAAQSQSKSQHHQQRPAQVFQDQGRGSGRNLHIRIQDQSSSSGSTVLDVDIPDQQQRTLTTATDSDQTNSSSERSLVALGPRPMDDAPDESSSSNADYIVTNGVLDTPATTNAVGTDLIPDVADCYDGDVGWSRAIEPDFFRVSAERSARANRVLVNGQGIEEREVIGEAEGKGICERTKEAVPPGLISRDSLWQSGIMMTTGTLLVVCDTARSKVSLGHDQRVTQR